MVSLVNSHTNATSKRWHLWEVDLRFAHGLPPGRYYRAPEYDEGGEVSLPIHCLHMLFQYMNSVLDIDFERTNTFYADFVLVDGWHFEFFPSPLLLGPLELRDKKVLITLTPSVERYNSLCTLNTSPPRNRCTFL